MLNILDKLFRDTPTRVQIALAMLWATILFSCLESAFAKQITFPQTSASLLQTVAILIVVNNVGRAFLYLKIAEGRVWARNIFFGLAAFSLLSLGSVSMIIQQGSFSALLTLLFIGVDGVAAALLMQAPKVFWEKKAQ